MSGSTAEIIEVCEALPPEKRLEVIDFARFLLVQQDDARWESLIAEEKPRPRLGSTQLLAGLCRARSPHS